MWPGNTADVTTLIPVIDRLRRRFAIARVCVVADRGMISAETLAELEARRLLYILGVRERTDKMVRELGRSRLAPAGRRDASLDLIRSEITRWRYFKGGKPGGACISVWWGNCIHKVMLTPRNWSLVKSGAALRIRSPGYSEEGRQWGYWNFAGGIDGDLVVEYGRHRLHR